MFTTLLLLCGLVGLWVTLRSTNLFHVSAYSASLGNVTNNDLTAASDTIFGVRNNHLIVTDPLNCIAIHANGVNFSRLRFNNAQLVQYFIPHIWPLSVSATIEDLPPVIDWRDDPFELPNNEEIILEATTTAVGPQRIEVALFLAPPNWTRNRTRYQYDGIIRGTSVIAAGAEGAWGTDSVITFERDPINGVYEIFGAEVVAPNAEFFRLLLPDQVSSAATGGKQFRPGGLVQDSASLEPWEIQRGEDGGLGVWGRFHTFTPPRLQVFGDAAGGTYEVRLHVGFVGTSRDLVRQVAA